VPVCREIIKVVTLVLEVRVKVLESWKSKLPSSFPSVRIVIIAIIARYLREVKIRVCVALGLPRPK